MSAHDFVDLLHAHPFRPFRIHVSGGTVFEIYHPELVVPGISSVLVGIPPANEPKPRFYERFHVVAMNHVTRLEPIESTAAAT
jgi:hypothetical protein